MAAVRGRIQDHVVGPAFDAAFQHRLERLVGRVIAVERQIVAEHDEVERRGAQQRHQRRQRLDILAVNLDQLQAIGRLAIDIDAGMRRLDQRRLAHAARAPQQRVVGGISVGEAFGVLEQDVAHPVDALEQAEIDAVDARDRRQPPIRVPDEGIGAFQHIGARGFGRGGGKAGRDGLQRARDSVRRVMVGRRRWTFCRGLR